MKNRLVIVYLVVLIMAFASCSGPKYLALPDKVSCPIIQNTCTFGIQNMDQKAKVESNNLVCHYKDFDVQYTLSDNFILSLTIINNSNTNLLIDKTKCFVMYDGNATQLFKDARMTGSTTFNDVTGSTHISTNHGRVMMIIPSYSKWSPTLNETNLRSSKVPPFMTEVGLHHLSVYDNPEVVEFSFEYTFDKKQAKWDISRNKVYVNAVNVTKDNLLVVRHANYVKKYTWSDELEYKDACGYQDPSCLKKIISSHEYINIQKNGEPDFTEIERIDATNREMYNKHNAAVVTSRIVAGIITTPVIFGIWFLLMASYGCYDHLPPH